jgi:hypothetical protein
LVAVAAQTLLALLAALVEAGLIMGRVAQELLDKGLQGGLELQTAQLMVLVAVAEVLVQ